MQFKVKGTKTTLTPKDEFVISSYAKRPSVYEPVDAEAKKAVSALTDGETNEGGNG